jgi:Kef-type K+ transport system membrane component KefB
MKFDLPTIVIGDIALIVVVSWLFGAVARRLRQPTVIGQIVAGLALGPTVLGQFPGNPTAHLFPDEVRPFLSVLSQVTVVIFVFVAGYEVNFRTLRAGRVTVSVAVGALLVPMGLALGSVQLFHGLFTAVDAGHVNQRSFPLYMAVAVSITALPVLAAIVRERGAAGSRAGTAAIAAAGFMDVAAWLVLAAALAGTGHSPPWSWPVVLALLTGFVAVMFFLVRPVLRWWLERPASVLTNPVPVALALALGSAWVTGALGLHAVFGGLLAGMMMPRRDDAPDAEVLRPMEQVADMLLPLFFVTTGLSFNIGTLAGPGLAVLALLLLVATGGKVIPAYIASRLGGMDSRQSAVVAALVNTRGLTELIVLNVGLSAGLIGPELFTALVLMALITTFMAGPLLSLIDRGDTWAVPAVADGRTENVRTEKARPTALGTGDNA